MSDLQSIIGEIDKIIQESKKTAVFEPSTNLRPDEPTMEEISSTVAGVVMEEFPAGGNPEMFGYALVEAAIGASEDMDISPAEILAGVVTFFNEALNSAQVIAENYDHSGMSIDEDDPGEEGGDEDEDGHEGELSRRRIKTREAPDDDDDEDEDEDEDEPGVSEAYGNFADAFPDMGR